MCAVGDIKGMAQKCIELLENEDTLNQFRQNAFLQARRFDIDQILPQYEEFYEEILRKSKINQ